MQTYRIENRDGQYHWRYEMSLFKNPTIFLNSAKAIAIAVVITMVFLSLISLISDGFTADSFKFCGKLFLIIAGIFLGLLLISYPIYAAIMGGSYVVDFTMDEKTILHAQSPKQAKKAEKIGAAAAVMGVLTHTRGAVSAGVVAAGQTASTVEFDRVKQVTLNKKRSVIKLRSFGVTEVYADGEDFDFVAQWIRARIPETAKWIEKA